MAAAAGIALAGGSVQRLYRWWSGDLVEAAVRPVQATVDVVVAVALALLLPRHRSTRLWGLVLLVPMAWSAAGGLDLLATLLG